MMYAEPVTPDELLRAIHYVRAVHAGDQDAMTELTRTGVPIEYLLVELAGAVAAGQLPLTEAAPAGGVPVVTDLPRVFVRALQCWAESRDERDRDRPAEGIAESVANYLLASVPSARGDLVPILDVMAVAVRGTLPTQHDAKDR